MNRKRKWKYRHKTPRLNSKWHPSYGDKAYIFPTWPVRQKPLISRGVCVRVCGGEEEEGEEGTEGGRGRGG